MIAIDLKLDGDGAWPDLVHRDVLDFQGVIQISGLPGGMESGKPSVSIRLDLDKEMTIVAQTSLALFLMAADALKARYGDPRQ